MTDQLIIGSDQTQTHARRELWCTPRPELYELPRSDVTELKLGIDTRQFSLWRYRMALPFKDVSPYWRQLTLGEGATPLVEAGPSWPNLRIKVEYMMPTLSFKDRGAAVMLAKAAEWKVDHVVTDSSGNAGTALAAYATRAGMACDIFVPSSTSRGKLIQIERHGATVHKIDGPRKAATAAAQQFVADHRIFYASHVYNPYFHEGTKTFAYELWEQLGFRPPDSLFLPVGHGTLVLGACKGFLELRDAGLIDTLPVIHAVQAAGCAPLARAFATFGQEPAAIESAGTLAEGIAISAPPRGAQILEAIRATGGGIIAIDDDDTRDAQLELAAMGYFVEPTAAITFAAYRRTRGVGAIGEGRTITVVPLCGAGLKTPGA